MTNSITTDSGYLEGSDNVYKPDVAITVQEVELPANETINHEVIDRAVDHSDLDDNLVPQENVEYVGVAPTEDTASTELSSDTSTTFGDTAVALTDNQLNESFDTGPVSKNPTNEELVSEVPVIQNPTNEEPDNETYTDKEPTNAEPASEAPTILAGEISKQQAPDETPTAVGTDVDNDPAVVDDENIKPWIQPAITPSAELGAPAANEDLPIHYQVWKAILEGHDTVQIQNTQIDDPKITFRAPPHLVRSSQNDDPEIAADEPERPHGSLPPADGFVLAGSIKLFGIEDLVADFYSYHGPYPAWLHANEEPIYQMAVLSKEVHVSTLLPSFAGTIFDAVSLGNVSFCFQNMILDPTKPQDFSCTASITIDSSQGQLHDVLQKVLSFNQPSLAVTCTFPFTDDWHEALKAPSFCLTGVFTDAEAASPYKGIQIIKVGVGMIGLTTIDMDANMEPVQEWKFGFNVFGTMYMTLPGSATPFELEFAISEFEGVIVMEVDMEGEWEHAFGISYLTLEDLSLEVELDLSAPLDSLAFDVAANLTIGTSEVAIEGFYNTNGDYSVSAYFENLGVQGLVDLFVHFFGDETAIPEIEIHIGDATLMVDKQSGLTLTIHNLRIGEHSLTDALATISSAGLHLKGNIDGDILNINDVEIKNAFGEIFFGRKSADTKTGVLLGGELVWEGHEFDAAIHMYKGESEVEYTVLGQFKTLKDGEPLPFTTLIPELGNTWMKGLALQQAAFIAASREDADLTALTHVQFPVNKGIQICAVIDEIGPVKQVMRGDHPDSLILNAGWIQGSGFTLDILFPSSTTLHLGRGITTDPIQLKITLGGIPKLMVFAGAKVPVEKQIEPLHFIFELELDEVGAAATGQLSTVGGWRDPFGVSEQLVVGPDLALKLAICWETFLEIGPSGFGFVGGLLIGKVGGQLAFDIEEIPTRELLKTQIEKLDLQDLVAFAAMITSLDITLPPNVINFEECFMYICPDGTTIGTIVYPPGFSFSARVILFGIHADIGVTIASGGVQAKGGIDNFSLGPLTVRGVNSPRAYFEFELTSSKQEGKINGMIDFLGIEVSLVASFSLQPHFTFDFCFDLTFAELFNFTVHASPVTELTEESHDVSSAEYRLTAEFREKIRGHMAEKLNQMFDEKARQEAKDAEHVQGEIEEKRKEWVADVEAKQREVDAAYAVYTAKSDHSKAEHDRIVIEEDAKFAEKQKGLDEAKAKLKMTVADAQAKLTAAQNEQASRIKADQEALNKTRLEWDGTITQKHQELDRATQTLHNGFGNAESNIDSAKQKVDSLQWEIDDAGRKINDCENAHWYDLPAKAQIPILEAERAGLWIAKTAADGVLSAAYAVLQAEDFLACKGAMGAASLALDAAKESGDLAIKAAQATLDATQKIVDGLVAVAQSALNEASNIGQGLVDVASKALDDIKAASISIREGAQALLDELKSCAEWIAYEAATAALTAAKAAGSGAMLLGEGAVIVGNTVSQVAMRAWQFILKTLTSFVDITDVQLEAELGAAVGGFAFKASVRGTVGGDQFFGFTVDFNFKDVVQFLRDIFDKLVDLVENGILEGGKAITEDVEKIL